MPRSAPAPVRSVLTVSVAPAPVSRSLSEISPLSRSVGMWERFLTAPSGAADYSRKQYILDGLRHGFRVGYEGPRDPSTQEFRNHVDEAEGDPAHLAFVDKEMAGEVEKGRRAGPFPSPPFPNMLLSPLGVATKKHDSKLRLVHDYSYPKRGPNAGRSVNAHIPDHLRETVLASFDDAIDMLHQIRSGLSSLPFPDSAVVPPLYLLKIDVKSAYRLVPIHPDDYHLLGMRWRGMFYFDLVAPFGLASACQLWETIATALHWVIEQHLGITTVVHYVDDFLLVSVTEPVAAARRDAVLRLCSLLGVTISMEKLEGPALSLNFLGIGIDTSQWVIFLDPRRVERVQADLDEYSTKSTVTIHDLQVIAGVLHFCCKVIRQGRPFLRRIINYTSVLSSKTDSVLRPFPVAQSILLDIQWWREHLGKFNHTASISPTKFPDRPLGDPLHIATDACTAGYGAVCGPHWLHGVWTEEQEQHSRFNDRTEKAKRDSMPFKELLAILIAVATWGELLRGHNVTFLTDCEPVVSALNKGDSRRPALMALIRRFSHLAIEFSFHYTVRHISGEKNVFADALSRSDLVRFHSLAPQWLLPLGISLPYFNPSPSPPVTPCYSL